MWKFKYNFSVNKKNSWNCGRRESSCSSSNSDEDQDQYQESTESVYSLLVDQDETILEIPQSWRPLGIEANSKSWEVLNSSKKTEQDIVKIFEIIKPEEFDIDAQFPNTRNTLLHEASSKGKPIVLEKLLEYKPDVNSQNREGETPIMSLVKESRKSKDPNIFEAHISCLKILMKANANLSRKNNVGLTVLSYATMCSEEKREEYLKELLHTEKKDFATGLYQALKSKLDIQFLEELNRICLDIENEKIQEFMFERCTLLQSVCEFGMQESVKRLLDLGADPNFAPLTPYKPIQLACIFSQPHILQLLIERDESLLHAKTKSDRNLFHSTVMNISDLENAHQCLKILLNHRNTINIDEADKHGRTPLHYAVLHDRDECAVELLNNGAKIDLKDKWKQTPLTFISKTAFEKYLDSMIMVDSEDDNNNTVENMVQAPAVENEEKLGNRKKKKKKRAEKSRTIIFDFSNLLRKVHQDDVIRNSSMTQSELHSTQHHFHVSLTEDYYSFPIDLLCEIKDTKRLEKLIIHPVLSIIIYFKWFHVRAFVYMYLSLYILFCSLFTLYIYLPEDTPFKIVPANSKSFQSRQLNILMSTKKNMVQANSMRIYLIIPLLVIIVIFLSYEWVKFWQKRWKYLFDMNDLLRLAVIIFAIFVMFCLNTDLFSPYCPQLKAISILLTWFDLFLVVGKYPNFSYYVSTFQSASVNLFKFVSVHLILLIGFALSFHTLFRSSSTDNKFTNPFNALFKTIVMLTAEFDASNIPFDEYSVVSHFIFILYIFLITIVLLNLMVAIALKQVNEMERNRNLYGSLLYSRFHQIEYIKHFEDNSLFIPIRKIISSLFPTICNPFFNDSEFYTVTPEDMMLKVSIRGIDVEFKNRLIFESYPEEKVRIEMIWKRKKTYKKWYDNLNFFRIFNTWDRLHRNDFENAKKIVSKRVSKREDLKKENFNLKKEFEILRNELIEHRRFMQTCFEREGRGQKS